MFFHYYVEFIETIMVNVIFSQVNVRVECRDLYSIILKKILLVSNAMVAIFGLLLPNKLFSDATIKSAL